MAEDDAWRNEVVREVEVWPPPPPAPPPLCPLLPAPSHRIAAHGVQEYKARPRDVEPDALFHGVYLKGLPPRLTLAALCSSIRAGRIYRIFLSTSMTTSSDALIAFVTPTAARSFYRKVHTDGLRIGGHDVRPSGVFTDHRVRYGVSEWTQAEVVGSGWTRCLRLANVPGALTADVVRCHVEERSSAPTVESVVWSERARTVQLNMAGVCLAQSAMAKLRQRKEYGCVEFTYAPDPCEATNPPPPPPPPPPPQPALSPYRSALLSTPNPNPSCRRLVFTELPYRPRLSAFAQHIRGGVVEGIHLYTDTPLPHRPPVVAIVVFKHPAAAWRCYLYLTTTATAKLPATLLPFSEIRVDQRPYAHAPSAHARRSVRITPHPRSLAQDVAAAIAVLQRGNYVGRPSQLLEGITTDPDDAEAARVVFSQIRVACTVVARLKGLQTYRRCAFSYVKDLWESAGVEDRRRGKVVRFALA